MNTTEELTEEAYSHGAETIDWRFTSDRIKGLYAGRQLCDLLRACTGRDGADIGSRRICIGVSTGLVILTTINRYFSMFCPTSCC